MFQESKDSDSDWILSQLDFFEWRQENTLYQTLTSDGGGGVGVAVILPLSVKSALEEQIDSSEALDTLAYLYTQVHLVQWNKKKWGSHAKVVPWPKGEEQAFVSAKTLKTDGFVCKSLLCHPVNEESEYT